MSITEAIKNDVCSVKEPVWEKTDGMIKYNCPACGRFLASTRQSKTLLKNYCHECGQKIDWKSFGLKK